MKTMILNEYGEQSTFTLKEQEKPKADRDEVLIKIAASSVNPVDTKIRKLGRDFPIAPETPAILGMDFAGTVESVGSDVNRYSPGDEVYGCAGGLGDLQGTLAEYIAADARLIAHKPKSLSMREAAALPLVAITAYEGLKRAHVEKENKVLVHGGTGGVGHMAVQMAEYWGADVYATASSDKKLSIIEGYGATPIHYEKETVDQYVKKYTEDKGFDIVYDSIGGENLVKSFEATAVNGEVATTVSKSKIDLSIMHDKALSLHVVLMLIPMIHNINREQHGDILRETADMVASGKLKPLLDDKRFSLEEAGKAHAYLEDGKAIGKVVIENDL